MTPITRVRRRRALLSAALLSGALALSGCGVVGDLLDRAEPAGPVLAEVSGDYYTVLGPAQREREPKSPGTIEYCKVDRHDRATCAYGELTADLRKSARDRGRQEMTVDPAGWGANLEVTIPAVGDVKGSQSYYGWFWNRSHLVADSLGGNAEAANLVTGTRTQNVGSTQVGGQASGGMAYAERIARKYLDSRNARDCSLYYAVTPVYTGKEPIPRTVVVDMQSCDKSVDMRVEVANAASGWAIDYLTGDIETR